MKSGNAVSTARDVRYESERELPILAEVDVLVVGGGISNTFVAAAGNNVGNSKLLKTSYMSSTNRS